MREFFFKFNIPHVYRYLSEEFFIAYADVYRVSLILESRLLENKYLKSAS